MLKFSRRKLLLGAGVVGAGLAGDVCLLEPRWLKVSSHNVKIRRAKIHGRCRILHLSDLHASRWVSFSLLREAVTLGLSCKPDVVCLTGDFISGHIPDETEYIAVLKPLSEHCPCFACLGNHDGGAWARRQGGYRDGKPMTRLLESAGCDVLPNESRELAVNETIVELVGLGDYWSDEADPEKAFKSATGDRKHPRVVLSHNPDSKELLREFDWDLMLCGHTHGGQLSLPIVGTPFAPVRDHAFVYGLNKWDERWIYTTSGVGNLHGTRLHCRPEVAVLDLVGADT